MMNENKIVNHNGRISVTLDVYLFDDNGIVIAYSPALDISGYGETEAKAKESFEIVMDEYIRFGLSHRTLIKDLRSHGWKVKSFRQRKMSAPSFDLLLKSNDVFKDILENKEYRKISEPFPEIA